MQRQQAATQQQYLELLRHLVTVGVPPPPSILTPALQSSGPQSQGQPSFHLLSDPAFPDFSATYSELTGQPTPSHSTFVTTSDMSASETAAFPVTGAATTDTLPSLVASTDPPTLGVFQAQATVTDPIVASTPSVSTPPLQTQTTSLPRSASEG
jgi:hypothetical protein